MKNRIQILFLTISVLLLVTVAAIMLTALRENRYLKGVIRGRQKQLTLSANDCRQLTNDLSALDSPSLAYWKLVFQRGANGQVDHGQPAISFQERIDTYQSIYKSVEAPRRSNCFAVLLLSLVQKQHDEGLLAKDLVSYLGTPDWTSNTVSGDVLSFAFSANGKQITSSFETANGVVSRCSVDRAEP